MCDLLAFADAVGIANVVLGCGHSVVARGAWVHVVPGCHKCLDQKVVSGKGFSKDYHTRNNDLTSQWRHAAMYAKVRIHTYV
jgi:hypothetical protein